MPQGKSPFAFEKKEVSQIKLVITFNCNYSPRGFLTLIRIHGKSHMNTCQGCRNRLSLCHTIWKCLKLQVSQTRKLNTCFLRLMFHFRGLFLFFNSLYPTSSSMFIESLQGAQWQVPVLLKKRKVSQNDHLLSFVAHLLSFVVTRCHSLPLVVILCHSFSLVVPLVATRCTTRCHSLYHSSVFL